jgi:hypothetical protein
VLDYSRVNVIFKDTISVIGRELDDKTNAHSSQSDVYMYIKKLKDGTYDVTKEHLMEGLTSKALQDTNPAVYPKGCYDQRYHFAIDNPLNMPIVENLMVVPMLYKGQLLGALQFFNKIHKQSSFYTLDKELLSAITGLLAGVTHVTNQLNEAFVIIYEFKKRIDAITLHVVDGH